MYSHFTELKQALGMACQKLTGRSPSFKPGEEEFFRRELKAAMDAWQYAENHFKEATDEDLIDQAAYDLLSAKSRYTYLLKQARQRGFSL